MRSPSRRFYTDKLTSQIADAGLNQMIKELADLRPDPLGQTIQDRPLIQFLDAIFRHWPEYRFVRIESGHLWNHEFLKTRVSDLEGTETYKLLRDLCDISGDHPERHHRKRLYQALNHLTRKCLPPLPRSKRRKR